MTSPSTAEVANGRYLEQQAIARAAADVAAESWSRVNPADIAGSWVAELDRPLAAVTGGQQLAAEGADRYLDRALAAQELAVPVADGSVAASRLAGIASDGRPLASLLYQPAIQTLQAIGAGAGPAQALRAGGLSLDMIVRTQVADAGRVASGVGITARNGTGYVRQLSPPSCSRCAILAGRFYRWSEGFKRHPRCDCVNVPTTRAAWRSSPGGTPRDYFDSLSRALQDRVFTRSGAEAIRDGADMGKVVNARRGMQTASYGTFKVRTTTEGATVRGLRDGQRVRPTTAVRLMPEQIYLEARGNRDEALRLLRLHGYLL